jgi:HSP20 family protein
MDDVFDDFMDVTDRSPAFRRRVWAPAVDVKETDKAYILQADLPGMEKDDVDVRVETDRITLSSSKEEERETEEEGYLRRERFSRRFKRSFRLPADVNREKIDAEFKNGVLTVNMPRTGESTREQGRKTDVKT